MNWTGQGEGQGRVGGVVGWCINSMGKLKDLVRANITTRKSVK